MSEEKIVTSEEPLPVKDSNGRWSLSGVPLIPMIESIQNYIDGPPMVKEQLYSQACSNDTITIESWTKIWIEQISENAKKFNFNENSSMIEYGKEATRPIVIAGSGPSLKKNAHHLKNRGPIKVVSCLHNFGFLEDLGVMRPDDYYLTLDAGEITISEVSQGGKRSEEEYWEITKDRTLLAFTCTHPELLKKWRGRILFFLTPIASQPINDEFSKHIDYTKVPVFNVGGNALGACLYFAKAIVGGGSIIFIGADLSFDYTHKFHSWDSPYDKQFSGVIPATNIFGNRVYTWQSYFNFKTWFEYIACGGKGNNPQLFINSTEGGILGAWPNGNIRQFLQIPLKESLYMFTMYQNQKELIENSKKQMILLF